MSLILPEDAEPFLPDGEDISYLHNAGIYALRLTRPPDLANAWDRIHDHRPPYWADLRDAGGVIYVGSAKDVLARLTDHKDKEVRLTVLTEVCEIDSLRNIWWCDADNTKIQESKTALMLQNERPDIYVHQR